MIKIISFLENLEANNNKEWFHAHQKEYKEARKEFETITEILVAGINNFDPSLGFPNPKDCIFRINRDIRFSKNKEPYKTNFGSLIARGGKKSKYAGYYLHIAPGGSFIGGGMYMPDTNVLKAIRTEIFNEPDEFRAITENKTFKKYFTEIYGDKLKTAPRGFPKDNPNIELIRHKHYAVVHQLDDDFFKSENFINDMLKIYEVQFPLNQFLNEMSMA